MTARYRAAASVERKKTTSGPLISVGLAVAASSVPKLYLR